MQQTDKPASSALQSSELLIRSITPEQTYSLRHAVLWPDKPVEYVKVENDADGYHFGAFLNGDLVAVISLFVDEPGPFSEVCGSS